MQLPHNIPTTPLRQLFSWLFRPYKFLDDCAKNYGDTFTVNLAGHKNSLVFISDPRIIKEIFSKDAQLFDAGSNNGILQPLLGNQSLLLLDGASHKRERKMLMPHFHGESVKSYCQTICDITQKVMQQWKPQQQFLASKEMPKITLELIVQIIFGLKEGDRYEQLNSSLLSLLNLIGSPLGSVMLFFPKLQKDFGSWSPWGNIVSQRKQVYELLQAEIEERRRQTAIIRTDVLSLMLSARDETGQPMTDWEVKDELMTMLVAGHETTASALSWALDWIHRLPGVKAKLLEELNTFTDDVDLLKVASLPYLNAVVLETLRICPILPITSPRTVLQDLEFEDKYFAAKTILVPCIYLLHQREDIYPDPKTFNPERFLERKYSTSEFIPFGGGNRHCLGSALAILEIKLVLATILTNCSLKQARKQVLKPMRRSITIAPKNGVPLVLLDKKI